LGAIPGLLPSAGRRGEEGGKVARARISGNEGGGCKCASVGLVNGGDGCRGG